MDKCVDRYTDSCVDQKLFTYKHKYILTQVFLCGLKPETIMEIATRALSFWTFQSCEQRDQLEQHVKILKERKALIEQQSAQLNTFAQNEFASRLTIL